MPCAPTASGTRSRASAACWRSIDAARLDGETGTSRQARPCKRRHGLRGAYQDMEGSASDRDQAPDASVPAHQSPAKYHRRRKTNEISGAKGLSIDEVPGTKCP